MSQSRRSAKTKSPRRHLWTLNGSLCELEKPPFPGPVSAPACGPCLLAASVYLHAAAALREAQMPEQDPQSALAELIGGSFSEGFDPKFVTKMFEKAERWATANEILEGSL